MAFVLLRTILEFVSALGFIFLHELLGVFVCFDRRGVRLSYLNLWRRPVYDTGWGQDSRCQGRLLERHIVNRNLLHVRWCRFGVCFLHSRARALVSLEGVVHWITKVCGFKLSQVEVSVNRNLRT